MYIPINIKDVVPGQIYQLSGNIRNGRHTTHENVVRKVLRVTNIEIICACGRRFIIDNSLKISRFQY